MDASMDERRIGRRSFLGYMIGAVGAFVASVMGASTTIFAASPILTQRRASKVTLGLVSGFKVGEPKSVDFQIQRKDGWVVEDTTKSVIVVRTAESEFATFSPRCTHLGCVISWYPDQKSFRCPCHGGVFSIQGEVMAGPPPRPLDRLQNSIEGGKLVIDYKEFRLGVPEKVEA